MAIPTTSPPVLFRNKQLATHFFGSDATGQQMRAIPRAKFMYYVNFVVDSTVTAIYPEMTNLGDWRDGISFMVKSIDRPNIDMQTVEVNEYNRKRVVYNKVKYSPTNITFHDTVDDRMHTVWLKYFQYYFGDSRPKTDAAKHSALVESSFYDSSGWGFRPINEAKNFFQRIEIYAIFGGRYTQINYINPRISRVEWQRFDSASAAETTEVSMGFDYEFIEYTATGATLSQEQIEQMGFTVDVTVEPENVPAPINNQLAVDAYSLLQRLSSPGSLLNSLTNSISTKLGFSSTLVNNLISGAVSPLNNILPQSNSGIVRAISSGLVSSSPTNVLGSFGNFNWGTRSVDPTTVFAQSSDQLASIVPTVTGPLTQSNPLSAIDSTTAISNGSAIQTTDAINTDALDFF